MSRNLVGCLFKDHALKNSPALSVIGRLLCDLLRHQIINAWTSFSALLRQNISSFGNTLSKKEVFNVVQCTTCYCKLNLQGCGVTSCCL